MSRAVFFAVIFALIFGMYVFVRTSKESYKILPLDKVEPVAYADWKEFSAPTGEFSVTLPVLPQHAKDRGSDPITKENRVYNMYVSEMADGTIFMISLIKFPDGIVLRDTLLTKAMNDMLNSNPNNELKEMEAGTFQGNDALDYTIGNSEAEMRSKTFLKGDTLYVLTMIVKVGVLEEKKQDFQHFINSFQLGTVPIAR